MRISLLHIFWIEQTFEKYIGTAARVHCFNSSTAEYYYSYLKFFIRGRSDVPTFIVELLVVRDDVDPASDIALIPGGRGVKQLPSFNWLIRGSLPLVRVKSILKVDFSSTNFIITKNCIPVHDCNSKDRASWKHSNEFYHLIKVWVRFIFLVFISIRFLLSAQFHNYIGI